MLKPGDTFERYTIDAAIGHGGMGVVYRAHDSRLDRRVALKVLGGGVDRGQGDGDARLLREARAAAALDHPNAVSIFDVGEHEGATYIVMELVSGRTLREVVGDASVPVATRVTWLADVARALAAAHRRGLVHRDIKPENVMVRDDGVVKVLDFGIARRIAGQVDPSAPTLMHEGERRCGGGGEGPGRATAAEVRDAGGRSR
jgi:eukaryotic-like serine/threonine-protein kinase